MLAGRGYPARKFLGNVDLGPVWGSHSGTLAGNQPDSHQKKSDSHPLNRCELLLKEKPGSHQYNGVAGGGHEWIGHADFDPLVQGIAVGKKGYAKTHHPGDHPGVQNKTLDHPLDGGFIFFQSGSLNQYVRNRVHADCYNKYK